MTAGRKYNRPRARFTTGSKPPKGGGWKRPKATGRDELRSAIEGLNRTRRGIARSRLRRKRT